MSADTDTLAPLDPHHGAPWRADRQRTGTLGRQEERQAANVNAPQIGRLAFPSAYPAPTSTTQLGMTVREYYAALAMHAILINAGTETGAKSLMKLSAENCIRPSDQIAKMAYEQADAMLEWKEK